jgi:hypothetical protein
MNPARIPGAQALICDIEGKRFSPAFGCPFSLSPEIACLNLFYEGHIGIRLENRIVFSRICNPLKKAKLPKDSDAKPRAYSAQSAKVAGPPMEHTEY